MGSGSWHAPLLHNLQPPRVRAVALTPRTRHQPRTYVSASAFEAREHGLARDRVSSPGVPLTRCERPLSAARAASLDRNARRPHIATDRTPHLQISRSRPTQAVYRLTTTGKHRPPLSIDPRAPRRRHRHRRHRAPPCESDADEPTDEPVRRGLSPHLGCPSPATAPARDQRSAEGSFPRDFTNHRSPARTPRLRHRLRRRLPLSQPLTPCCPIPHGRRRPYERCTSWLCASKHHCTRLAAGASLFPP